MKEELKNFLGKEDSYLLQDFKWGNDGANQFSKFMHLIREELNYKIEYNFIRMINNETGEVRECNATDECLKALYEIILDEPYIEHVTFEGNSKYVSYLENYKQIVEKSLK